MKGGHLYIVSGASGSGKTTLVNEVLAAGDLNAVRAPKYSERQRRDVNDDISHVERISADEFDVCYVINDNYYGVRTSEIEQQLNTGKNSFIILSDFNVVERLKERLGPRCSSVYVSSAVDPAAFQKINAERHARGFQPTEPEREALGRQFYRLHCAQQLERWPSVFECMGDLVSDWGALIPNAESARIRAEKIRSFHNRYVDNLTLFDHVVLNHSQGKPGDMVLQMRKLIRSRLDGDVRGRPVQPVLMVVAAASGAGKGLLMETMGRIIGSDRVAAVTKLAKRDPKPNDRRDGMRAITADGQFPDDFDFRWTFHNSGTEYAIRTSEVWVHIGEGRNAVVLSNVAAFEEFRERFGDQVVFVYLHATRPESEIRDFQLQNCRTVEEAKQRVDEIREVHDQYMEHIAEFHHVLLNTAYKEDLFDQMLGLVKHYESASRLQNAVT